MIPELLHALHKHDKERKAKMKADKIAKANKLIEGKLSINKFGKPK